MSAEKIGSLTNIHCGSWKSRMQTGKYLTSLPTPSFLECSGVGWGMAGPFAESMGMGPVGLGSGQVAKAG